jgi:formylmethanofuran dehydrogenase subunit E
MIKLIHTQKGSSLVLLTFVICFVTLFAAMGVSELGVSDIQNARVVDKGKQALVVAESCMEDALLRLRTNTSLTSGNLTLTDAGTCSYMITGSGSTRQIVATGVFEEFTKRIQTDIQYVGNEIKVSTWQELTN